MTNNLTTIGFSKKHLRKFVDLLQSQAVAHLIDTRLNNTSQLSGYAKKDDLMYIMSLVDIKYTHNFLLAPEGQMLDDYRKKRIGWGEYEKQYIGLLEKRKVENDIDELFAYGVPCFLCSEDKPHHCHRRLLAEYLQQFRDDIKIIHLT